MVFHRTQQHRTKSTGDFLQSGPQDSLNLIIGIGPDLISSQNSTLPFIKGLGLARAENDGKELDCWSVVPRSRDP